MDDTGNPQELFPMLPNPDERHAANREQNARIQEPASRRYRCLAFIICCLILVISFAPSAMVLVKTKVKKNGVTRDRGSANNDQDTVITEAEMQSLMDYNETLIYKGPPRELLWPSDAFTAEEEPHEEEIKIADHTNDVTFYHRILEKIPKSFRANYGLGRVYESYAYVNNRTLSKAHLRNASFYYKQAYAEIHDGVEENIKEKLPLRIISICEDIGDVHSVSALGQELIDKNRTDPSHWYRLALAFERVGSIGIALRRYKDLLQKWPEYGPALRSYGFLKYKFGKWKSAVEHLTKSSAEIAKADNPGPYYEAVGEALQRLDRTQEAIRYYRDAISKHIFRSMYQRSYDNIDHLIDKPWWSVEDFKGYTSYLDKDTGPKIIKLKDFYKKLRSMVPILRREVLNAYTSPKDRQHFEDVGFYQPDKQLEMIQEAVVLRGGYKTPACRTFPQTVRLFNTFPPTRRCGKCDVKYVLLRKTHLWPTCKSTNAILTTHLALSVPDKISIRVYDETRTWTDGDVLIFGGSFEHEIWNNETGVLILLSFDMWHPGLYPSEIRSMKNYLP